MFQRPELPSHSIGHPGPPASATDARSRRSRIHTVRTFQEFGLFLVLLFLVAAASVFVDNFCTTRNFTSIVRNVANVVIISGGLTLLVISKGIDLSVGSVMALVSVVTALAYRADLPWPAAVAAGIASGLLVGLVNAVLVNQCRLNPILTTLATMTSIRGLAYVLARGVLAPADLPLPVATHAALNRAGDAPALPAELAGRAKGAPVWGVLRGDVDGMTERLKKAASVEEHIQISVLVKQLFAGEAQALAAQPEFRRKVTILYTGGDDFAVFGAWDALVGFAQEFHRIFGMGSEAILEEFAGNAGKTLSMALSSAPSRDSSLASVYVEAGRLLEIAKSEGRDTICLFGRTLDWKQFGAASDLKKTLVKLIDDFGCPPQLLGDLAAFYRETDRVLPARAGRRAVETQDRPWRFHRRLGRVLDVPARSREYQKARKSLLEEFLNRRQASVKLKPSGRVALDWARLAQEGESR